MEDSIVICFKPEKLLSCLDPFLNAMIKVKKTDISAAKKSLIFLQTKLYLMCHPMHVCRIWCDIKTALITKLCGPSDMHVV